MSERFNINASGVYGETPRTVKKAVPVITDLPAHDGDESPSHALITTRKVWFAPLFPRDKLAENLNKVQEAGGYIFSVLVQGNQVQLIYYMHEELE